MRRGVTILEGLEETLTVIGFALGASLRIARNVKRWRGGSRALRLAVSGLLKAQKRFRRVKGCREIPQLIPALEATIKCEAVDTKAKIA